MNVTAVTLLARALLLLPCRTRLWFGGINVMEFSVELQPVYPHHDLLIELGRVEMAMDYLEERSENERQALRPRLLSRMTRLRDELAQLAI
jgi:hypothetical protein